MIVRSSANVQAGAATRASAVLHSLWILAAVALLPWALRAIPMAALAGVLVVTGWRLISLVHFRHLLERYGALPAAIWRSRWSQSSTNLLTGVLVGVIIEPAVATRNRVVALDLQHAGPKASGYRGRVP